MSDSTLAVETWEALFSAQVAVMRKLTAEFPPGDISLSDYDVLYTLSKAPGRRLRIKSLGENMLLTQPSVSRLIDRLTARGLVTKNPDSDDRRGVMVELTPEGYDAFRRTAVRHMQSIVSTVGGALSTDELREVQQLATKLRDRVRGGMPDASDSVTA